MFYGVIVSHMLVVLFAACGISGIVVHLDKMDPSMEYSVFLMGLAESAWPLAVAAGLYMMVQIACQVQQAALLLRMQGLPTAGQGSLEPSEAPGAAARPAPAPRRAASLPKPVAENSKPVSFFDISDAVTPPPPASGGADTPGDPRSGQSPESAPRSEGETPSAPACNAGSAPADSGKPEKDRSPHFFTLD